MVHQNKWVGPLPNKSEDPCEIWNSFLVGKLWLRGQSLAFYISSFHAELLIWMTLNFVCLQPPSLPELHRFARGACKSHFSKLNAKLHEINPSVHFSKSLKVVAEATALASPAPVHQGQTPYELAEKFGKQKVMGLLHPVPRWKAVEEWWRDEHLRQQKCVQPLVGSWPCWLTEPPMAKR